MPEEGIPINKTWYNHLTNFGEHHEKYVEWYKEHCKVLGLRPECLEEELGKYPWKEKSEESGVS
jgi:hypothetical protein